jgi:hypothetical protein
VGDKGKILAGFRGEDPRIIPERRMREYQAAKNPQATPSSRGDLERGQRQAITQWIAACKGGPPTYGDFLSAGPISDAFNLAAVSLRMGGKRLLFDSARMEITNNHEANKHLRREYRKGWELG